MHDFTLLGFLAWSYPDFPIPVLVSLENSCTQILLSIFSSGETRLNHLLNNQDYTRNSFIIIAIIQGQMLTDHYTDDALHVVMASIKCG